MIDLNVFSSPARQILEEYLNNNIKLQDPFKAEGQCSRQTEKILGLLSYDNIYCQYYDIDIKNSKITKSKFLSSCQDLIIPQWVKHIYLTKGPGSHWGEHRFPIVEDFCIDFTARQFDKNSPWPLIWETKWK